MSSDFHIIGPTRPSVTAADRRPPLEEDDGGLHRLLKRQMRRHLKSIDLEALTPEVRSLLESVNAAYKSTDADRDLMERSLELTSLELNERNSDLARSNEELRQFAYVVSHDLQEPLRSVAGYTKLLARRYQGRLDAEADELVQGALDGVERMRCFIVALLEYSRVGRKEVEPEEVDLGGVLDAVKASLTIAIEDHKARIEVPDRLPRVSGDAVKLNQLLQNLIGNALKFRRPEHAPEVRMTWRQVGAMAELTVQDNGIGIPAAHRDRVFELFQRLHRADEVEGTGLGLAICQKIVWQHGGRIWIDHPEDVPGTTFKLTLPLWGAAS